MTAAAHAAAVPHRPPTPDEVVRAVVEDIRAHAGTPEGSVRAIARRHGVSKSTVGRIADDHGLGDKWADGTAQTQQATETRMAHVRRQRALMQEDLLDKASILLDRVDDPVTHLNVVKCAPMVGDSEDEPDPFIQTERVEQTVLPPGPGDYRAMAAAITSFTKAAVELAKLDVDTSATNSTVGLLDQFAADLAAERAAREAATGRPE